ncbi:MAG: hypothetical protein ABI396_04185 [Ktedonobacteraceae bacterium]
MSAQDDLYIERFPGDLLTAEDWNDLQRDIKQDIVAQVADAVKKVTSVDTAKDSDKLGGKTPGEWSDEIVQKALAAIPAKTNYRMLFKRLEIGVDKMRVVEHGLKACPLVDVYQLDYFRVVCSTGDTKDDQNEAWVNFYLYHSSERRIRLPSAKPPSVEIETIDQQPYKILFKDMLELYKGKNGFAWTADSTLDDLETDFWKAFFQKPNDDFDEDQYCHSPWFEKCCGEKRTVGQLMKQGDWDDIWFKVMPLKTDNYPVPTNPPDPPYPQHTAPSQILVTHFDFDTLGIALLGQPDYPPDPGVPVEGTTKYKRDELKVMMLLKV